MLLKAIEGHQTIITATHIDDLLEINRELFTGMEGDREHRSLKASRPKALIEIENGFIKR
jgi:hypothetical protein